MEGSRVKVKIPGSKVFTGTRNSKELENFLWDIEHYFETRKIPKGEQVSMVVMICSTMRNFGGKLVSRMLQLVGSHELEIGLH